MIPAALLLASAIQMASPVQRPQVMVLGVYHFANPGLDAVKVTQRDITSDGRQREVIELVKRLAKFKPTKILVEVTPEYQADLDNQFSAYLKGARLSQSETQQVGFRLAKDVGLQGVLGVDFRSPMDFDSVMAFAMKNGMSDVPSRLARVGAKIGQTMSEWDAKYTVAQVLAIHNDPNMQREGQAFYTDFLRVYKDDAHPGADMVAGWYRRNLVIFQNIRERLQPGDRALVIFGSGHAYYLNQLIRERPELELVEVRKFLPKPLVTSLPSID